VEQPELQLAHVQLSPLPTEVQALIGGAGHGRVKSSKMGYLLDSGRRNIL